jgi:hypothetical protein
MSARLYVTGTKNGVGASTIAAGIACRLSRESRIEIVADRVLPVLGIPAPPITIEFPGTLHGCGLRVVPEPTGDGWAEWVIADTGTSPAPPGGTRVLVTRNCYLATASGVDAGASGDILAVIDEPGRQLTPANAAMLHRVPRFARVAHDFRIGVSVDRGLAGEPWAAFAWTDPILRLLAPAWAVSA